MSTPSKDRQKSQRYIAVNRRARHNYFIEDSVEAGIVLVGTEVKSLRTGQASIQESFAGFQEKDFCLLNAYIAEYGQAGAHLQHETYRPRKLLLHKRERAKLLGAAQKKGYTIIPLSLYFNKRGLAKVELGIARGKDKADKRETSKEQDWKRDKARILREKNR